MSVGFNRPLYGSIVVSRGNGTSVSSVKIDPTAGESTVVSSALVGKTLILVTRSGVVYKETTDTPAGREYSFDSNSGTVTFGIVFNSNEDVIIQYK